MKREKNLGGRNTRKKKGKRKLKVGGKEVWGTGKKLIN